MEGNNRRKTTGYWTTPEKESGANTQSGEYNRGRDWKPRAEFSYMPQTPRQSEYIPQYARREETNPGYQSSSHNQPLQSYYGQPTQWTPQPSCSNSQNRFGAATASGYNYSQPRSLFDRYKEGEQNVGWRPDWRYTSSLDHPQQRSHYGSECRGDSYGYSSDNQMKRKECGDKDQKEHQNQNVKRRSTLDPGVMVSPLEGLYGTEDTIPEGRGYGVQRFRLTRSDGNTKRREVNKNKKEESWDTESRDVNKTSGSNLPKKEENWDEPEEAATKDKDDKKTSPKIENPPEEGGNWNKIDTIVSRSTGISFGFYQEIAKADNEDNTDRRADEGWTPLEETRNPNRSNRNMSQDRSPQRDQSVGSPERSRSRNRFDRSANRRMAKNYGYQGNRSRSNYDYNSRRNVWEDWDSPEQFNTNFGHWSYNRGWNQYSRGRSTYRNNYNRNTPRRVEDWDAPDETTDTSSKTGSKMTETWDEPKETIIRDKDDKNTSPNADKERQEENLESASRDNDKKNEEEDEEEAQRQRERDRNFAALMRYIDEDWGPPQWPSRSIVKTDSSSDSPKDLTSSDDSKEKTSSDPYDWITNRNTSERKPEVGRKSPDPIISKRSDSDEDSNTDESPQEEMKSATENENTKSGREKKSKTCESPNKGKNTKDDEDDPDVYEGKETSNGRNSNVGNDSKSQKGDSNTNGSNEEKGSSSQKGGTNTNEGNKDKSKSSKEKETESVENLESSEEREISAHTNAVEINDSAEKTEATVLERTAETSTSSTQTKTSGNRDDQELTPAATVLETRQGVELTGSEVPCFTSSSDEKEGDEETTEDRRGEHQSRGETTDDEDLHNAGSEEDGFEIMIQPVESKPTADPKASKNRTPPAKKQKKKQRKCRKPMIFCSDTSDETDAKSSDETDSDTSDETDGDTSDETDSDSSGETDTDTSFETGTDTSVEIEEKPITTCCNVDLEKLRQNLRELARTRRNMAENEEARPVNSLDPENVAREFEQENARIQERRSPSPNDQDLDIDRESNGSQPDAMPEQDDDSLGLDDEDGFEIRLGSAEDTDSNNEENGIKRQERLAMLRTEMFWRLSRNTVFSDTDSDDEMNSSYDEDSDPSTLYRRKSSPYKPGYRRKISRRDTKVPVKVIRRKRQKKVIVRSKRLFKISRQSRVLFKRKVHKFKKLTPKTANRNYAEKKVAQVTQCQLLKTIKTNQLTTGRLTGMSSLNYWLKKSQLEYPFRLYQRFRENIAAPYKSAHSISRLNRRKARADLVEVASTDTDEDLENNPEKAGQRNAKCAYSCRMCQLDTMVTLQDFLYHTTAHSEEYSECPVEGCDMTSETNDEMRVHIMNHHTDHDLDIFEELIDPLPNLLGSGPKYGFLCSKCTFVQALRRNVEFHVKRQHDGYENIPIIKINLSEILPDRPKYAEENNEHEAVRSITDGEDMEGNNTNEEDVMQSEPQNKDCTSTGDDDTVRFEESVAESKPENKEESPLNPTIEGDEQIVNENETASTINPSSPDKLQRDSNDEYEDQKESKKERKAQPFPCQKSVPGCSGIGKWNSLPILYGCFAKKCTFVSKKYSDLQKHVANVHSKRKREEDSDSSDSDTQV